MTTIDWIVLALAWSLIPACLVMKAVLDARAAEAQRILGMEIAQRASSNVKRLRPASSAVKGTEKRDRHGRRYFELPAGVGRYETKPERVYMDPASSTSSKE